VQLENSFTVPVPVDEAWRVLLDIERIAPCMPGAALDTVTGDEFTGRVKVKLGPINLTYQGKAAFVEKDEAAHRAVIDARGKDQRGNGTASAVITANLQGEGEVTRVHVLTDLNITGRPAQFGRGVMTDVGNKLLGQFADKLAAQLGEGEAPAQSAGAATKAAATVTGAAEEVAASAEGTAGDGAAGRAVKKTAATAKKAAARTTDAVTETAGEAAATEKAAPEKAAPAKAPPAKAAPAKKSAPAKKAPPAAATAAPAVAEATPAAADSTPVQDTAPAAKAPSGPPSGPTAPPSRPATGAPARTEPSVVAQRRIESAEPEPIDLLEVAGGAALTRYAAPAGAVAALLVLLLIILRRRRG
jgi:carbon monoxide dehydrogenase subunit G